ncbi:MAG: hypothetical protein EA382_15350, partial [Spirochaetaceae bacterium]
ACRNYTDDYWVSFRRHYYANVAQIDEWVGRIVDAVEDRYGDNSLIIFTADHGEMLGHHGLWGKNNCAYEEVWAVPLIAKFPGKPDPWTGRVESSMVTTMDVTATCTAAAGEADTYANGHELRSLSAKGGRTHVFAEGEGFAAITDGTRKLVHVRQPGGGGHRAPLVCDELYDRSVDPAESRNLISDPEYASIVAELRGIAVTSMMETLLA